MGQAATVKGEVVNKQGQPVEEAEVFLVSEKFDYGEYQFVRRGTFYFIDVPIGHYMLYGRIGDPDRPEATKAMEIKEEKQVYAIELHLKAP